MLVWFVDLGLVSLSLECVHETGTYKADIRSAGSVMLLFQVSLPCAIFSDGAMQIDCKGGTNCIMAPQVDFTETVFQPVVSKMGVKFSLTTKRRGFFPRVGRGLWGGSL